MFYVLRNFSRGFFNIISTFSLLIVFLGGCGTYVPDVQEFWGSSDDVDTKVRMITHQVKCELQRAFQLVMLADINNVKKGSGAGRQLTFLKKWGADLNLTLTIDEKSTFAPNLALNTPLPNAISIFPGRGTTTTPQTYSTNLGASISSDGYRQDRVRVLYGVQELVGPEDKLSSPQAIHARNCLQPGDPGATVFLQSDLKIYEWLRAVTKLQMADDARFDLGDAFAKDGVITHEVKFQIVSSGNINPSWKLLLVSAGNGPQPLFLTSRDRTQDLIITIGPVASQRFQQSVFSTEIASAINNSTRLNQ